METMTAIENTQEVSMEKDHSTLNNVATGFCLIGAGISICETLVKAGRWAFKTFQNRKAKNIEPAEFEEVMDEE